MENSITTPSIVNQICALQTRVGGEKGIPHVLGAWYRNTVLNDIIVMYCNTVLNRSSLLIFNILIYIINLSIN